MKQLFLNYICPLKAALLKAEMKRSFLEKNHLCPPLFIVMQVSYVSNKI